MQDPERGTPGTGTVWQFVNEPDLEKEARPLFPACWVTERITLMEKSSLFT